MSGYTDFNRPILEDPATIERRFQRALARVRGTYTVTADTAWAQRSTPPPGSRLEDYAYERGALPSDVEVRDGHAAAMASTRAEWRKKRRLIQKCWNEGV